MSRWLGINLCVAIAVTAAAVLLPDARIAVGAAGLAIVAGSELIRHGVNTALHRADVDEQKVGLQ